MQQETACMSSQRSVNLDVQLTYICVNFRIDTNKVIKVADFGLSEDIYSRTDKGVRVKMERLK